MSQFPYHFPMPCWKREKGAWSLKILEGRPPLGRPFRFFSSVSSVPSSWCFVWDRDSIFIDVSFCRQMRLRRGGQGLEGAFRRRRGRRTSSSVLLMLFSVVKQTINNLSAIHVCSLLPRLLFFLRHCSHPRPKKASLLTRLLHDKLSSLIVSCRKLWARICELHWAIVSDSAYRFYRMRSAPGNLKKNESKLVWQHLLCSLFVSTCAKSVISCENKIFAKKTSSIGKLIWKAHTLLYCLLMHKMNTDRNICLRIREVERNPSDRACQSTTVFMEDVKARYKKVYGISP